MKREIIFNEDNSVTIRNIESQTGNPKWLNRNFSIVADWIVYHENNPRVTGPGRKSCAFCSTPWTKIDRNGFINLLGFHKNIPNQSICDECADSLEARNPELKSFLKGCKSKL